MSLKISNTVKDQIAVLSIAGEVDMFSSPQARNAIMELVNEIYVSEVKDRTDEISMRVMREAIETAVLLLSPFVPHFAEELWEA